MRIEIRYCCRPFVGLLENSDINLKKQTLKLCGKYEITCCPFCGTKIGFIKIKKEDN